jgi:hypothetical protein
MIGEGTEMVTFRFLHRVTFQAIAIFLALTAAQAAEVVNLGVPNYNNIILPYFVAVDKGYYRDEGIELDARRHCQRARDEIEFGHEPSVTKDGAPGTYASRYV